MRILQVASEAFPLVKTGGLADVVGALSDALASRGHDVRVIVPAYRGVLETAPVGPGVEIELGDPLGVGPARLHPIRLHEGGAAGWALHCPSLYDRAGGPYLDTQGVDHPDNALRFALLARAAATLGAFGEAIGWAPEVVHAHDWQAGLVPAYMQVFGGHVPPCVFTVHNLQFAGMFAPSALPAMGLPWSTFAIDGLEFYGGASMLKAGLWYAQALTTVSETYAEEIKTFALGCGLHGLLSTRAADLRGVVNGIDTRIWNPATDGHLPARYSTAELQGKEACGRALRARFGVAEGGAVIGMVSRLTDQKGIDLLIDAWKALEVEDVRLVVLGTGAPAYEAELAALAEADPSRVGFVKGYDESLSHLVVAGSDLLAVPSRFEPCGLTQMYAMRYGTLPVVRRTGGLADTVIDEDEDPEHGTGLVFETATAEALADAIRRGLAMLEDAPRHRAVQARGMSTPWGWDRAAAQYEGLYEELLAG
jgi:starch synthase